jgi:hypothetical protein
MAKLVCKPCKQPWQPQGIIHGHPDGWPGPKACSLCCRPSLAQVVSDRYVSPPRILRHGFGGHHGKAV